jgi:streptogramin lyase
LWIGTGNGGLSLLNSDSTTFTTFRHDPNDPTTISSNKIVCMMEDSDHTLWVGTFDAGLNKFDPIRKTFVSYQSNPSDITTLGANYVYDISQNTPGELWVSTDGALNLFTIKDGTVKRIEQSQGNDHTLASNIVTRAFFDVNDRMWVGTRFGGLNIYDKGKYGFKHFKYSAYEKNTINHNNVTAFAEHKDGFWLGTDGGGVNFYDRKTGKFTNYMEYTTNPKVLAVAQDKNEGLWLGMWAGGLNHFDVKTKKVRRYLYDPDNPRSLAENNIFDILIDRAGNVWVATFGSGLCKYNPETDDFTRFVNDPSDPNSFAGSVIVKLMEDSSGKIWIATEQQGVDEYDPATGIFKHHKGGTNPGQLSGNSVFSLWEDSQKRIWVGTNGSGLNLYNRKDNTFKTYRQKDGLPNDVIMGILEDEKQQLWISTNKGISRFNPKTSKFKNYTESDGLQSDQFNRWSYLKLSTGELLFGGTNGFNMFNPATIVDNTYKPPVFITDLKVFNKPVPIGEKEILKQNIILTKEITLSYKQNIFSFEFTALNYRQPEKNQYKYIMEGFQDEWIEAGSERKVSYTNLSPGEYTFRVIASNNDGLWNEEGAAIKIIIIPPFWRTWWFISLLVLSGISAVVGYIQYQKRKAKRQQAELNAIIEERTGEVKKQNEEILKKAELEKVYNWITQGLAVVSETISKNNNDLNALGNETLKCVVKYVEAQQGVIALGIKDEPTDEHLKILATYGVSKKHWKTDRIEVGSGMLGETYKDKEKRVLEHLPEGYLKIESGLGEAAPAKIILMPLKTEDGDVVGVMELAFLGMVTDTIETFLDKVASLIALNIFAVTLTHKTMLLLQQSKEQTEEMRAQEEEMRQNMEELEATQEEFRRRELEFQKKIDELETSLKHKR